MGPTAPLERSRVTSTDDGHDVLAADKLDEPAVVGDEPSRAVSKRKPRRRRPRLLFGITIVFALIGVGVAANGLRESDSVDDRSAYSPTAGDPARVRPSPRLLLLQNTPPTAADVANASAAIDALPYDGMVVYSAASSLVMRSRPLDVDALIAELSVLTPGLLSNVTHNFLLVYATPAGPFREYGRTVAANFGLFARAARGAGFAGDFFDVE